VVPIDDHFVPGHTAGTGAKTQIVGRWPQA
jgi:hypothetical protein